MEGDAVSIFCLDYIATAAQHKLNYRTVKDAIVARFGTDVFTRQKSEVQRLLREGTQGAPGVSSLSSSASVFIPAGGTRQGQLKRDRSTSSRLRLVSVLIDAGVVSVQQKGALKDLIITGDSRLESALEAHDKVREHRGASVYVLCVYVCVCVCVMYCVLVYWCIVVLCVEVRMDLWLCECVDLNTFPSLLYPPPPPPRKD